VAGFLLNFLVCVFLLSEWLVVVYFVVIWSVELGWLVFWAGLQVALACVLLGVFCGLSLNIIRPVMDLHSSFFILFFHLCV